MKQDSRRYIDDKIYSVVGPYGFRRGCLSVEQACKLAAQMQEQMGVAGWRGDMRVLYRDGSEVDWRKCVEEGA